MNLFDLIGAARTALTTRIADSTPPGPSSPYYRLRRRRASARPAPSTSTILTTRASPHRNSGLTSHLADSYCTFSFVLRHLSRPPIYATYLRNHSLHSFSYRESQSS